LQNCDELFEREELSAAPDPGWPDCFNSGVFVYKPSQDTFGQLLEFARTRGSFDGKTDLNYNSYCALNMLSFCFFRWRPRTVKYVFQRMV